MSLVSQSVLISRLAPLKRVLCLCPVRTKRRTKDLVEKEQSPIYRVGCAVSDPYLAHAIPIEEVFYEWSVPPPPESPPKTPRFRFDSNFPTFVDDLFEDIGYTDIGAVALGLPMIAADETEEGHDQVSAEQMRNDLGQVLLAIYGPYQEPFKLQCHVEGHRKTLAQVEELVEEHPHMWEEIDLSDEALELDEGEHPNGDPTLNACVALNAMLLKETDGWPNTFG